ARLAHPHQHACCEVERQLVGREAHADQPERIEQCAEGNGASRTVAVGQHAHEDGACAPHQVLYREGQGEHVASPTHVHAHDWHEQTEGGAYPQGEQDDEGTHVQGAEIRSGGAFGHLACYEGGT